MESEDYFAGLVLRTVPWTREILLERLIPPHLRAVAEGSRMVDWPQLVSHDARDPLAIEVAAHLVCFHVYHRQSHLAAFFSVFGRFVAKRGQVFHSIRGGAHPTIWEALEPWLPEDGRPGYWGAVCERALVLGQRGWKLMGATLGGGLWGATREPGFAREMAALGARWPLFLQDADKYAPRDTKSALYLPFAQGCVEADCLVTSDGRWTISSSTEEIVYGTPVASRYGAVRLGASTSLGPHQRPVQLHPGALALVMDAAELYWPVDEIRIWNLRLLAQLMSPKTCGRRILVVFGPPGTGKSLFVRMLRKALGEAAGGINAPQLKPSGVGPNGALAQLRGKALAVVSEAGSTYPIDAETLKALTGGDDMPCRDLYDKSSSSEYRGMFMVVSNSMPRFTTLDPALVERIIPVYFGDPIVTRDVDAEGRLKSQACADALLTLLLRWWSPTLPPPPPPMARFKAALFPGEGADGLSRAGADIHKRQSLAHHLYARALVEPDAPDA